MPYIEPTFWDYVRAAFQARPVVRGLGGVPWNKVALVVAGILGFGNPGFWLLGLGGELAYLYWMASNPRFQNLVRGERLAAVKEEAGLRLERSMAMLSTAARERFGRLRDQSFEVQRTSRAVQGGGSPVLDEARLASLDQLLWLFLRLLVSLETLDRQMAETSPMALQTEITALGKEIVGMGDASERLKKSKESLLDLTKKRLENYQRAGETRLLLTSELLRIEQQIELLREEAAIARSPEALSSKIDAVAGGLTDTNSWIRQHEELLSDLGIEETLAAPPHILDRQPVERVRS
ncbi:MAG: hypothetical protein AB1806_16490 [Acidobacteriota bacterium]